MEKKVTFADVLKAFETSVHDYKKSPTPTPKTEKAYAESLQSLATAVTYSVLKKCINVSADRTLLQARRDVARDSANIEALRHASNHEKSIRYNADGDSKEVITDKDLHRTVTKLVGETLGDGSDLVSIATVSILEEAAKATERNGGTLPLVWIEKPYTKRQLRKKVYIQSVDSVNGWTDETTTPIQEVYRAVRRYVESNRSVKSASFEYLYIDELLHDDESDTTDTVYRRMSKYSDLGAMLTDFNGKDMYYTPNRSDVDTTDDIIEKLNLTDKQARILRLRQAGYGYKAIATYIGVTQRAVAKTVQAIQAKAENIGFTPEKYGLKIG